MRFHTRKSTPTTAITPASLPPNTLKADIRPVFHHFGELKRIFIQPGGMHADVAFAGIHGVKRTLRVSVEWLLRTRRREIIKF